MRNLRDQDLLLAEHGPFGSGVIGVCDICGTRQAVIVLQKERYKLCVIDFLNKSWVGSDRKPGVPAPLYQSERVWYETDLTRSGRAPAIVLSPTKVVKHPMVLITPDVYGITTQLLDAGLRFAREGFEVLLPDIGKTPAIGPRDHIALRLGLRTRGGVALETARVSRFVALFEDAMRFLRNRPMVDADKMAVFGADFGGSLAIAYSAHAQKLSAIALAYPMPVHPPEYLRLLTAPILLVTPWQDRWGRRSRREFQISAATRNIDVEFADFVPVGHGFLARDLRGYDMNVAEAAWGRMISFLRSKLLPPPPKLPPPTRVIAAPTPGEVPARAQPPGAAVPSTGSPSPRAIPSPLGSSGIPSRTG
jgi:dienelactone hydrolase